MPRCREADGFLQVWSKDGGGRCRLAFEELVDSVRQQLTVENNFAGFSGIQEPTVEKQWVFVG